ncbi:uncharacterized protein LOC135962504 [Calliphora vicina]|uniref:uncharacterized protein LOC135962504 n=1 Tax=Calliphora vicina TaxID=7373 RepID=UPI00325AB767
MKFLLFITLICVLVVANRAAVGRGIYKDPAHPGKCVVDGSILSPGEEATHKSHCYRMICGNDGMVTFHTCGVAAPPPGFKLGDPIMPTEPYPNCCRKAFIPI